MRNYRKALMAMTSLLLAPVMLFAGCAGKNSSPGSKVKEEDSRVPATLDEAELPADLAGLGIDPGTIDVFPQVKHDEQHQVGFQLEPPQSGDTVAVMHTSAGDITLRLFSEQAPKTVTNFITLAQNGKYNNTTFYLVEKDKRIVGGYCGSEEKNISGDSAYGSAFEDEFCDSLCNLRGAVAMANTAKDANGSSFFINETTAETFAAKGGWSTCHDAWQTIAAQLLQYKDSDLLTAYIDENGDKFLTPDAVPAEVKRLYEENGGNPEYDGAYNAADRGCTVFAQVTEGMETADKIAAGETDANGVPVKAVVIRSIEIKTV